ncbi:hypothetical protein OHT57_17345 [Streptomyces sp. NBC_00285]|uniref:hypothetical protein n=1 Tax=Streptomyces sp. NBC_00285 TaxID=2975700 RepID=UPI002E2C159F|nr:hypothetical protein [Streptomyces sp. NBC_00285]
MSVFLEASLWAAQSSQVLDADHSILGADQPYVPQQPDESNRLVELLTSAQAVLGMVVVLIAVTLLVWQVWSSRREDREEGREGEGRKESGPAG